MRSLIIWGDIMNRYIVDLAEHGLRNSEIWFKFKKLFSSFIRNHFLNPKIGPVDITRLPKLPKGCEYLQWRINAYNEYQEGLKEQEEQGSSIWEGSL
jgi:hypothetical protein